MFWRPHLAITVNQMSGMHSRMNSMRMSNRVVFGLFHWVRGGFLWFPLGQVTRHTRLKPALLSCLYIIGVKLACGLNLHCSGIIFGNTHKTHCSSCRASIMYLNKTTTFIEGHHDFIGLFLLLYFEICTIYHNFYLHLFSFFLFEKMFYCCLFHLHAKVHCYSWIKI